jgi:hypothetical protein
MLFERWGGNLAVSDVAPVIAVGELSFQFSQIALPIGSQHNAKRVWWLGVLPFTTTNFICRSQRDWGNKAIAAPRDIDNEPIPITSVAQPAAQCRNMDGKVGRLDK